MPYNQQVIDFARRNIGAQIDADDTHPGECWDLAEKALMEAGAATSRSLTPGFSRRSNYVWGDSIGRTELEPGDIIQFRGYRMTIRLIESTGLSEQISFSAPHHTAIVEAVLPDDCVKVLEQNARGIRRVTSGIYFFRPIDQNVRYSTSPNNLINIVIELFFRDFRRDVSGGERVQIVVTPTVSEVWFYRPTAPQAPEPETEEETPARRRPRRR